MLPLIVFIIVDSVYKKIRISITAAVLCAAVQMAFSYGMTHRFDWFILLDLVLIAGLGIIAIIFKNEMFFKVKPAIVECAAVVFLFVLILSPDRFLLDYFGRMMPPDRILNPAAAGAMKTMLLWMCLYVVLHIGAVLYTARYSSRKLWAIVSGPGFFVVFIPIMLVVIGKALRKNRE
jgi:intracellular septation protein A